MPAHVQSRYSLFMNQSDFWWIFYHWSLSWRLWESLLQNFLEIFNFKRCIILYNLKSFFIQKSVIHIKVYFIFSVLNTLYISKFLHSVVLFSKYCITCFWKHFFCFITHNWNWENIKCHNWKFWSVCFLLILILSFKNCYFLISQKFLLQ